MSTFKPELSSLRIDRQADARKRRPWLYAMLLTVVCGGAGAAYFARGRIVAQEVETVRPTLMAPTAESALEPILTASGYVVARRKAVVSAKIQGRLAELDVDEGSPVREGEVIARLDNSDYQAQIDVARAQEQGAEADLAEQQRQLRLAQSLSNAGVVPRDQLEAALSRVRRAEASLSQSKANVSLSDANFQNTFIRAPFTGVVVTKMAEIGESVAPIPPGVNLSTSSGAIVALVDMTTLEAEVDVSESNVAKLQRGQPAQVSVEAFPDRLYRAVLREVIPTADRTKATINVKVTILDKDKNLRPEMSAKVTFLERAREDSAPSMASKAMITVPKDTVVARNDMNVVFVVDDRNKVHLVPVLTGTDMRAGVMIKQGLTGLETLVRNPPSRLKDGDVVKTRD
jgi:HlyD family secretion protein